VYSTRAPHAQAVACREGRPVADHCPPKAAAAGLASTPASRTASATRGCRAHRSGADRAASGWRGDRDADAVERGRCSIRLRSLRVASARRLASRPAPRRFAGSVKRARAFTGHGEKLAARDNPRRALRSRARSAPVDRVPHPSRARGQSAATLARLPASASPEDLDSTRRLEEVRVPDIGRAGGAAYDCPRGAPPWRHRRAGVPTCRRHRHDDIGCSGGDAGRAGAKRHSVTRTVPCRLHRRDGGGSGQDRSPRLDQSIRRLVLADPSRRRPGASAAGAQAARRRSRAM